MEWLDCRIWAREIQVQDPLSPALSHFNLPRWHSVMRIRYVSMSFLEKCF